MNKRIFFAPFVCLALYCEYCITYFLAANFNGFEAFASSAIVLGLAAPLMIMLFGAFSLFKNSKITLYGGTIVIVLMSYLINDSWVYSLVYSLSYISAGFLLCYSALRKKSGASSVITVLICILLAEYGATVIDNLVNQKPPFAFIDEMFAMIKPMFSDAVNQLGEGVNIQNFELFFTQYEAMVRMMLPAILIIGCLFMAVLLSFLVKIIVNKVIGAIVVDLRFSMFKADGVTIFVFFLSAIVSIFAGNGVMAVVFSNIYAILNVVLFLCGLSLFDWFLKDVKKVRFGFRILIFLPIGLSLVFPVVSVVFTIFALIDARRNFRAIGQDDSNV